jgi:hypothetical protein
MGRFLAHDLALEAVDRRESKPVDCKCCRGHQRFRQHLADVQSPGDHDDPGAGLPGINGLARAENLSIRQARISSTARQNACSQTGPARIDQPSSLANMSLSNSPRNTL